METVETLKSYNLCLWGKKLQGKVISIMRKGSYFICDLLHGALGYRRVRRAKCVVWRMPTTGKASLEIKDGRDA